MSIEHEAVEESTKYNHGTYLKLLAGNGASEMGLVFFARSKHLFKLRLYDFNENVIELEQL